MNQPIAIVIDPSDHPFNGTVVSTRRFVAALVARGVRVRLLTLGAGAVDDPRQRVSFPPLRIPGVNRIIERMRSPLASALAGWALLAAFRQPPEFDFVYAPTLDAFFRSHRLCYIDPDPLRSLAESFAGPAPVQIRLVVYPPLEGGGAA
ncbi:MAG: hypothetical protein R3E86_14745 [Pseudomonadales bacterium]